MPAHVCAKVKQSATAFQPYIGLLSFQTFPFIFINLKGSLTVPLDVWQSWELREHRLVACVNGRLYSVELHQFRLVWSMASTSIVLQLYGLITLVSVLTRTFLTAPHWTETCTSVLWSQRLYKPCNQDFQYICSPRPSTSRLNLCPVSRTSKDVPLETYKF